MGRPRKNPAASKEPPKFVAVRKSSRQIARKQLKSENVEKVNGELLSSGTNDCSDDSSRSKDENSKLGGKKCRGAPKKVATKKRAKEKVAGEKIEILDKDTTESDSQDGVERSLVITKKLSAEDVRQMVVGSEETNGLEKTGLGDPNDVCWTEDVIEETIICEEMEVEGETMESSRYSLADDGSVVLEEVLLVNEPDFEGKNVVEFTVIRNEDGTESMVVGGGDCELEGNSYEENTREYHIIEEGVSCLRMEEKIELVSEKSGSGGCGAKKSEESSPGKVENAVETPGSREKVSGVGRKAGRKVKGVGDPGDEQDAVKKLNFESPLLENGPAELKSSSETSPTPDDSSNSSDTHKPLGNDLGNVDDELAPISLEELPKKSVSDLEDNENSVPEFPLASKQIAERALAQEDDDSAPTSEKSEPSRSEDYFPHDKFPAPSIMENDQETGRKDRSKPEGSVRPKGNRSNSISTRSPQSSHKNSNERPRNIEEISRDSEIDPKIDSDDIKLTLSSNSSSGSENSNDTSLSVNNSKLPDLNEPKNSNNEAEKKIGFRSRSGSTDTTGSESGSNNSSAVRRSSRIRTIGLMKQRSRGRGLVTKPNLDLSKLVVLQQERERLLNSVGGGGGGGGGTNQELRDTPDSQSETQSDREGSNKMAMSTDSQASSNTSSGLAGYESDSSKPVKVKSRWRRSSELEMGSLGSRLGFGGVSGFSGNAGSTSGPEFSSANSSCAGSSTAINSIANDSELGKNSPLNSAHSPIPRPVGAKIPLPMVLEVKDREMEERLSQFEHLRENAYLTERYTNKETKRMVCDCFLTEEEIERGELGCGEDCLNRLLMIECGSRCVVSDRCTNKRFQNCEYAKCEVFRTEKKGFGLRATSDLEAGEFIMEYVGEVLDAKDFRRRAKDYSKDKNRHYYFMALKSDQIIDATMKGNISRFINHSCDPNAETQKWTVNGELRIGFFNRRFVAAGEEITFDYHFQRYGKEAQRCYCEAPNCRGWIGDTPEEEKEKIEKKEKREKEEEKDARKKKEEKKPAEDYIEDEDLEEEIEKLCQCGLKNRAHTLNLSRLMVRSRELEHRTRLLKVIQNGEQPCRRLFLDYHGLRLLWSYMMDVAGNESDSAQQFRLEVIRTLRTLPIPNKTMLMDSKVYSVVQKWSEERYFSPRQESPSDELNSSKTKLKDELEPAAANCDSNEKTTNELVKDTSKEKEKEKEENKNSEDKDNSEQIAVSELAANLLTEWANLKEVFRIPKKERIEQMKEHEREADRGYREDLEKEDRREAWYDRPRPDRYGRLDDKRIDRRRARDSPDSESYRSKDKRPAEERSNLVPLPRLSKFERRQLFAMKVAKEEEERLRRQQQESWQEHEARCVALGIDPHTTATVDPQTGYPLFFNPALGQWQPYAMQDGEIAAQCTPMYGAPGLPPEISPGLSQQAVYAQPGFSQSGVSYQGLGHPHHHHQHHHHPHPHPHPHHPHHQPTPQPTPQYPDGNLVQMQNGTGSVPLPVQPVYLEKTNDPQFSAENPVDIVEESSPQAELPPMDLPPKWKCAKDARGRIYYYHTKERVSQWLPPPPDHIGVQPDSSSSSESSDESSSSNEDDDDQDEDRGAPSNDQDMDCSLNNPLENGPLNPKHPAVNKLDSRGIAGSNPLALVPEPKKRRDGLVQERIISPRREEDRIDHKKYKDVKEKMRRQKERARLKEHVDKLRKHRRPNKSKNHSRHPIKPQDQAPNLDITAAAERKIKDTFRINMANVMVHFLNPYRKNDCKQGRITNTEDFKHLARKLTHFVLAKELKHCKSVDELQCNENVKHKAKDFVRKYMNKFGEMYHKSDED